tara:strand:+ start:22253 stop:22381 length:129 start_codon:yes stop_codon:yes gene_type:complete
MGLGDFTEICVNSVKGTGGMIGSAGKGLASFFGGLDGMIRRT